MRTSIPSASMTRKIKEISISVKVISKPGISCSTFSCCCKFNFKTDKTKTVDGFLAHEVANVVPEAVVGEKDAVSEDGKIVPQGIDEAKLVPLLTAAAQELIERVEKLEKNLQ